MLLIQWSAIAIAMIALLLTCRLLWAWFRLRTHPHVESFEVAHPEIASQLNLLIEDVAKTVGIATPSLFIRRAALPNAFVAATIFRPELYLTDELLEHCNCNIDGLEQLTLTLCHEMTHIRRGDAIPLGLLTWGEQWASSLSLVTLAGWFQNSIARIEEETDIESKVHFKQMNITG